MRQISLISIRMMLVFVCALALDIESSLAFDWRKADRSSAGIAPKPEDEPRAVIQIYSARVVRWRKYFAVHTWLATKQANADHYETYHVIGWRLRRGLSVVAIEKTREPDARWFGNEPELLLDLRGPAAARSIPTIQDAARAYPYPNVYRAWPGPNSNTFISFLIRRTPELRMELPPHAIGKDWIEDGRFYGWSESKSGIQLSVYGLLGLTVGVNEGIEMNLLGLNFGVDILRPALKIPFVGRLGFRDQPIFSPTEVPVP